MPLCPELSFVFGSLKLVDHKRHKNISVLYGFLFVFFVIYRVTHTLSSTIDESVHCIGPPRSRVQRVFSRSVRVVREESCFATSAGSRRPVLPDLRVAPATRSRCLRSRSQSRRRRWLQLRDPMPL